MGLAEKCRDNGPSMVASVQYGPGDNERSDTYMLQPDAPLPILMVKHCAKTAPNIDSYMIGIARHCHKQVIDTSGSIFLGKSQDKG